MRWLVALWLGPTLLIAAPADYFAVTVTDAATGRGVPLAQLRSVNDVTWWTDSQGVVAIDDPGLMDTEVFVHVSSPGYEFPADGLGFRGIKLKPVRGGRATVALKRLNIAERLYRITGDGIYRDSVLAGLPTPIAQPVRNGLVMGQDTVVAIPYRGKIHWFWGDTERMSYPLGHFGVAGATSEFPSRGGLEPALGVNLTYFVDDAGFSKPMFPVPDRGMRWLEGAWTVRDEQGVERLVGRLAVMKNLGTAYEWHLVAFNDERQVFESIQRWERHEPHQSSHAFRGQSAGADYWYLYPDFRVKAELRAMKDWDSYEAFICIAGDGRWRDTETLIARDEAGRVRYAWTRGADRLDADRLRRLVEMKKIEPAEASLRLIDVETGAPLKGRPESVTWNAFRKQWIAFAAHQPGEVWFAAADTPVGPWGYARRVAMHDDYNFYNIAQHAFFDQDGGRRVFFEGTYTDSFSGARVRTPRYNYNQIMYRLDLADERLQLPVAFYRVHDDDRGPALRLKAAGEIAPERRNQIEAVAFFAFAPGVKRDGLVAVFRSERDGATELSLTSPHADARPLFVALPPTEFGAGTAIDGRWQCHARGDDASADPVTFTLELKVEQGRVVVTREGGSRSPQEGVFQNGRLALRLEFDGQLFDCEAFVERGRFSGTWKRVDAAEQGPWSGTFVDPTPAEWRSKAVVPLRLFRRVATGERFYAATATSPADAEPVGEVLCRVWEAPETFSTYDWEAQAVPAALP